MLRPRFLGVLLCYNDGDMLADTIEHLLTQNHDVIAWNHGSTDETASVLERMKGHLLEVTNISRDVDFYDMYPLMSRHLLEHYVTRYDWISWPDQDEILEGPNRAISYRESLEEAVQSEYGFIEFRDFVFWFTERDDETILSPCERVRHYALARHGPQKIRSWRASATNIRWFNHNRAEGRRYPVPFNLRHYPMRSAAQMRRRISIDRAGLQRGPVNWHYENLKAAQSNIDVRADDLYFDDGHGDLNPTMKFDWKNVYGSGPTFPRDVRESFLLLTRCWEIAEIVKRSLGTLAAAAASPFDADRIARWLRALGEGITCPIVVVLRRDDVRILTEDMAHDWAANPRAYDEAAPAPIPALSVDSRIGMFPVAVSADATERRIRIVAGEEGSSMPAGRLPLVALVPCYGVKEAPRVAALDRGAVEFDQLKGTYYYLTLEPGALDG